MKDKVVSFKRNQCSGLPALRSIHTWFDKANISLLLDKGVQFFEKAIWGLTALLFPGGVRAMTSSVKVVNDRFPVISLHSLVQYLE